MIEGFLDGFRGREVYGWCIVGEGERAAVVDLVVDGEHVGRASADLYREDLRLSGIRNGHAGFSFELDDRYCDGLDHRVEIRIGTDARQLEHSPQTFTFMEADAARRDWVRKMVVLHAPDRDALRRSLLRTKKLAIFATYHKQALHLPYHHHIVASLLECGFTVLVVHASDNGAHVLDDLGGDDSFLLVKRNIGYDFGSFATGFILLDDLLPIVEEAVLVNDSVVQIDLDLQPLFAALRGADADIVACTESFERHYHLQSYCLWLNKKVLQSAALRDFMLGYSFTSVKEEVIEQGEIGFSRAMQHAGLRLKALFDYPTVASLWLSEYENNVDYLRSLPGCRVSKSSTRELEILDNVMRNVITGIPANPSHFFWDVLVDHFDFPFIKRELIVANPCSVPTYAKIATYISANPRVHAAVYGMIRVFGGTLVPALVASHGELGGRGATTVTGTVAQLPVDRPAAKRVPLYRS